MWTSAGYAAEAVEWLGKFNKVKTLLLNLFYEYGYTGDALYVKVVFNHSGMIQQSLKLSKFSKPEVTFQPTMLLQHWG